MCFSAEVYEAYQPLLQRLELPAAVNAALFPASPVGSRQMHGPGGLDTIDRIRPHKSRAEGDNPLPCFSTTPVLIQPGYSWPSRLQAHTAGSYLLFCLTSVISVQSLLDKTNPFSLRCSPGDVLFLSCARRGAHPAVYSQKVRTYVAMSLESIAASPVPSLPHCMFPLQCCRL